MKAFGTLVKWCFPEDETRIMALRTVMGSVLAVMLALALLYAS